MTTETELDIDIMNIPFQALEPEITLRAVIARATKAAQQGRGREHVTEMDRKVDKQAKKDPGATIIRTSQCNPEMWQQQQRTVVAAMLVFNSY